jgi:hypothetical protein
MLRIGKEWQDALRSLKTVRTGEAAKDSATFYLRLLENYKAKADQLRSVVHERIQKYQSGNVEGYDLWAGAQQDPRRGSKRPAFGISEIPPSENFDFSKAGELAHWKGGRQLSGPSQLGNPDAAKAVIDPAFLLAHHLDLGEIQVRWTDPNWDEVRRPMHKPDEDHIYGKAGVTFQVTFKGKDDKVHQLFNRRLNSGQDFHYGIQTYNLKVNFGLNPPLERTSPKWGHGNRMIDPAKEVLLQSEIQRHWPGMRDRVFKGIDRIPAASVQAASQLVEDHFKAHREALERELWAGVKGGDDRLVDAVRQLTAGKAMLDAFVSLGKVKSLADKAELRDLLSGEKMTKGQTRLLDGSMLEAIATKGGTLLEATRDAEWLDGPATKLKAYFKGMPDSDEPQPLIEATMARLMLLKKMHEPAQPEQQTLLQAARHLKKTVQALGQR